MNGAHGTEKRYAHRNNCEDNGSLSASVASRAASHATERVRERDRVMNEKIQHLALALETQRVREHRQHRYATSHEPSKDLYRSHTLCEHGGVY